MLIETDDGRRVRAAMIDDLELSPWGQPALLVRGQVVRPADVTGWRTVDATADELADLVIGGYSISASETGADDSQM